MCWERFCTRTLSLTVLILYSRGRGQSIPSLAVLAAACLCSQSILLLRSRQGRKHLVWSGCTECLVPVWLPPPHQLQTAEPKKPGNRIKTAGGLAGGLWGGKGNAWIVGRGEVACLQLPPCGHLKNCSPEQPDQFPHQTTTSQTDSLPGRQPPNSK